MGGIYPALLSPFPQSSWTQPHEHRAGQVLAGSHLSKHLTVENPTHQAQFFEYKVRYLPTLL